MIYREIHLAVELIYSYWGRTLLFADFKDVYKHYFLSFVWANSAVLQSLQKSQPHLIWLIHYGFSSIRFFFKLFLLLDTFRFYNCQQEGKKIQKTHKTKTSVCVK